MPKTKLKQADKEIIMERLEKGASYVEIAEDFDISARHIRRIEKEQEELLDMDEQKRMEALNITWFNDEVLDPQLIRFWLQRVYSRALIIPANKTAKGMQPIRLTKERCKAQLAWYKNMDDKELLKYWHWAICEASTAFNPEAIPEDDLI